MPVFFHLTDQWVDLVVTNNSSSLIVLVKHHNATEKRYFTIDTRPAEKKETRAESLGS